MTKLAPSTSLPSILTSSPIPGDRNGSCVALALLSSQLEISSGDVGPSFCVGRSSASMLQLLISFGQSLRRVSALSKKSVPTILPAITKTAPLQSAGAGSFSSAKF